MDESSCQISAIVFTLANSYGSHSAVFSRILWMFFMFRSNTVCLKKHWLIRVIAERHYVNLLIFFTIIGPLLCVRHIQYTFIKKHTQYWLRILFHSKELLLQLFYILFHLLLLHTKYTDHTISDRFLKCNKNLFGTMLTWHESQFVCQELKLYTDVWSGFSQGREGLLK